MADLATVTGSLWRNSGAGGTVRLPAEGARVRFLPVLLDESEGIADSRSEVTCTVGADAAMSPAHLWPGEWAVTLPDGESFHFAHGAAYQGTWGPPLASVWAVA